MICYRVDRAEPRICGRSPCIERTVFTIASDCELSLQSIGRLHLHLADHDDFTVGLYRYAVRCSMRKVRLGLGKLRKHCLWMIGAAVVSKRWVRIAIWQEPGEGKSSGRR